MAEVKYPNFTLLLQGPSDNPEKWSFMEFIPYYKTLFGKMVLSTYTEHISVELWTFCKENDITVFTQTIDIGELERMYNITWHTMSVLMPINAGLIKTEYVIKHRLDERYSNLDRLVDLLLEDPRKLVTGATMFTSKAAYTYHAGDHLMLSTTEKMRAMMQLTYDEIKENVFQRNAAGEPAPEVTFTKNFVRISGDDPTPEKEDENMRKWMNFLNDDQLHPFVIRFNTINQTYTELGERPDWWRDYNTIDDILNKNTMRI